MSASTEGMRGHTGKKTNSSPVFHLHFFHFLALEWDISQDKIWIRSILVVSKILHFYKIYGCVLLGWKQCGRITRLCLHFSLILAASLGFPAPGLLSQISFCHLTLFLFHTLPLTFPVPGLFLCYQLPAFCQRGYLCNFPPAFSWGQRLSPK